MCGRFTFIASDHKLETRFKAKINEPLFRHYNAAPTQKLPIITNDKPGEIRLGLWGLIPPWLRQKKDERVTGFINARSESVATKPSFKHAFKKNRCLVLADSFFEWSRKTKQPYRIMLRDKEPFAFAGIWEYIQTDNGLMMPSFSIITTSANELVESIHDRMPLILSIKDEPFWLDNEAKELPLLKLFKPYPAGQMILFPVSNLVNSIKNDKEEVIEPVKTLF
jgi:putative SOS response-associated peptidase YedK